MDSSQHTFLVHKLTHDVSLYTPPPQTLPSIPALTLDMELYDVVPIPAHILPNAAVLTKKEDGTYEVTQDQDKYKAFYSVTFQCVRERRNLLLKETDWTQFNDSPLSVEAKESWRLYRQALRDMPDTCDPGNVVWPVPPSH